MSIAITGGSGFVGSKLITELAKQRVKGIVFTRQAIALPEHFNNIVIPTIGSMTDYGDCFKNTDCIVHAAARVHVLNDVSVDPLAEFREVNTFGTLNLARQAVAAGVKRFIFISSVKVNGESTIGNQCFTADDTPQPQDPYGVSKLEAEKGLTKIAEETGLEVVIIRPTLVYGPGVKANFESMMSWLVRGIPLPFGSINNGRSLVALDNLVSLILVCVEHPKAKGEVFMVSDDDDLSTTKLLRLLALSLGSPKRLIPISKIILEFAASIIGRRDLAVKLCSSLRVDISKTKTLLEWSPPVSVNDALHQTAQYYLETQKNEDKI